MLICRYFPKYLNALENYKKRASNNFKPEISETEFECEKFTGVPKVACMRKINAVISDYRKHSREEDIIEAGEKQPDKWENSPVKKYLNSFEKCKFQVLRKIECKYGVNKRYRFLLIVAYLLGM